MTRLLALALVASTLVALAGACADPVHNAQVDALGPEGDVPPGPLHRPGQPCVTCHSDLGPGQPVMVFGGTVYAVRGKSDPYAGVTVHLTDATGATIDATTNQAGNFWVNAANWSPVFPVHVQLNVNNKTFAEMSTHIGRDGSCGDCHFDPAGKASPGRIYLVTDPEDLP